MSLKKVRVAFGFLSGNVKIIIATNTARTILMSMAMPYFSLYVLALGGTPPKIGMINALGALATLILSPIGGYVADYKGRVKLIAFLSVMSAFSISFFVFARDWTFLAIGWFLYSLFMFEVSIENTIIADSLKPEERSSGFAALMAIPGIAGFASPYIAGYLTEIYGVEPAIRFLYTIVVVVILAIAVIRLKFLKETIVETDDRISLRNFALVVKASFLQVWQAVKWMPTSLRSIMTISFINNLFIMMVAPFTIVYAINIIKLSYVQWGLIALMMRGSRALLMIPLGMLLDKIGRRKVLLVTLALSPIPVFLLTVSRTFFSTFCVFLVIMIIDTINEPSFMALMADIAPKQMRGRINTAIGSGVVFIGILGIKPPARGFFLSISTFIGSFLGGYIYDFNADYLLYIFSASLIVCFLLFVRYIHEPERQE